MIIVLSTTFKNVSVVSWWSVLFVEETGLPGEYHRFDDGIVKENYPSEVIYRLTKLTITSANCSFNEAIL